jgi:hypothetical protein
VIVGVGEGVLDGVTVGEPVGGGVEDEEGVVVGVDVALGVDGVAKLLRRSSLGVPPTFGGFNLYWTFSANVTTELR